MMHPDIKLQHFILTRFNLRLWGHDKAGAPVRTINWLEHRFLLFERFGLQSIKAQTCQDFTWLVLFDSSTPIVYKERIEQLKRECQQLVPVFVETKNGRFFTEIFRKEVVKRILPKMQNTRVLTTYLDNDDALCIHFVEDIQHRASELQDGTFIFYTEGYQFFTDHKYLMKIHYPRNHFVSVVESGDPETIKTVYGYGSHYYIDKIKGALIEYVNNLPMWCQVVHERNMGNDAYFLGAKRVSQKSLLINDFGVNEEVRYGAGLYLFQFLPRYAKTFIGRCRIKLRGYRFE